MNNFIRLGLRAVLRFGSDDTEVNSVDPTEAPTRKVSTHSIQGRPNRKPAGITRVDSRAAIRGWIEPAIPDNGC